MRRGPLISLDMLGREFFLSSKIERASACKVYNYVGETLDKFPL